MVSHFYWAKVIDNADPDGLNQVKVTKIGEGESVTEWVPVITSYGGYDVGFSFLPDVDEQVLVVSLGAMDTQKAVVGTIWSNDVLPPQTGENSSADLNGDGENSLRFLKSRAGNQLIFDDTDGEEKIQLIASGGESRLEFSDADELVSLCTENDLVISSKGEISIMAEEINITSEGDLDVSTDRCQMDAKDGLDMETDRDMSIQGSGVALN